MFWFSHQGLRDNRYFFTLSLWGLGATIFTLVTGGSVLSEPPLNPDALINRKALEQDVWQASCAAFDGDGLEEALFGSPAERPSWLSLMSDQTHLAALAVKLLTWNLKTKSWPLSEFVYSSWS